MFGSGVAAMMGLLVQTPLEAQQAAAAAQDASATTLQEIVVTARKTSENLQNVPMSVGVISADDIRQSGAQTVQDLLSSIPSLSFTSTGAGRSKLTMRGVSSSAGVAPTVSFQVDEAPLAPVSSGSSTSFQQGIPDPNLFDVNHVEVLRGPQGTLYGASSMGGTVKVVMNEPDPTTTSGKVSSSVSHTQYGGTNYGVNGALNLPLVTDSLALRISASDIYNSGYIDRLIGNYDASGFVYGPAPSDVTLPNRSGLATKVIPDVNFERVQGIRAALRYQGSDAFYIEPSFFYQETRQGGQNSYDSIPGGLDQRRSEDVAEPFEDHFGLSALTIHYDFGPATLVAATSYVDRQMETVEDFTDLMSYFFGYDNAAGSLPSQRVIASTGELWNLTGPPFPATVMPIAAAVTESVGVKDFTQEVRLASNGASSWKWLGGLYFKRTVSNSDDHFAIPGYSATFPAYNQILGSVFGNTFYSNVLQRTYKEEALFGEATYTLERVWHFTAGVRAFKYSYDFGQTLQGVFTGDPTPTTTTGSASGHGVNPKVVVARDVSENTQAYLSATKGYRPGGTNPPAPVGRCDQDLAALGLTSVPTQFQQDWLWSYELGQKSTLWNNRVTLNTALYFINWHNVQQQVTLPTCGSEFTDNIGTAQSSGVEVDVNALLMRGLRATVGLSFDKAKFTRSVADAGVESGDKLLDAPELTASASVEYSFSLGPSREGYARAGYDYMGDSLDTLRQTDFTTGQVTPGIRKGGYGLVNLRLGMTSAGWDVGVYTTNLGDKRPVLTETSTIGQVIPTFYRVVTLQPRTVGLSVTKSF